MRGNRVNLLVLVALLTGPAAADVVMPTADTVGADAMPAAIEPFEAPFEMPGLSRPVFADRTVDIGQRGARPGSESLVTPLLQRCIDEVSRAGGGTVVVPPGRWPTGRIVLRSGVNLHLAEGAELHFSGQIEDYLPPVFTRCEGLEIMGLGGLVYAHGQKNIGLTGRGELIGPESGPVREARKGLSDKIVDHTLPVSERVFDGREGRHYFRPYFICPVECENVLIEGVSLRNGPMWNIVPIYCDGVIVRGVRVDSRGVVNGDGVNIESTRNALVEYCTVRTGDDCFALKAGRNQDGLRKGRPVENVVFRYNLATGGFGGVTCGSETAGGIRNVYARDCVFNNVRHALYFKTRRPRGGGGERFWAERIVFTAYDHAVFFDMLGATMYVGELANRLPARPVNELTPHYRDITLRHLRGTCGGNVFKVKGIPESPASSLVLEGLDIRGTALLYLADVDGVEIMDSRFVAPGGEVRLINARGVRLKDVRFDAADN